MQNDHFPPYHAAPLAAPTIIAVLSMGPIPEGLLTHILLVLKNHGRAFTQSELDSIRSAARTQSLEIETIILVAVDAL